MQLLPIYPPRSGHSSDVSSGSIPFGINGFGLGSAGAGCEGGGGAVSVGATTIVSPRSFRSSMLLSCNDELMSRGFRGYPYLSVKLESSVLVLISSTSSRSVAPSSIWILDCPFGERRLIWINMLRTHSSKTQIKNNQVPGIMLSNPAQIRTVSEYLLPKKAQTWNAKPKLESMGKKRKYLAENQPNPPLILSPSIVHITRLVSLAFPHVQNVLTANIPRLCVM